MKDTLSEQLVRSMFRFKKVVMTSHHGLDINMGEIVVMSRIAEMASCDDNGMFVSDIQRNLHITKPAISQMYNSLEKRGYIVREIDPEDRRKIQVTLTTKGHEVLQEVKKYTGMMLDQVISRLGESDTKQLINLFNRFADISEEIKKEQIKIDNEEESLN